jgi:ABC-type sugar transport system ATPase subunit
MMVGREVDELFPKERRSPAEVLLEVQDLSVSGRFQDVTFELRQGEVLGLVGLQGSGTSDVLRALFGHHQGVQGEVKLRSKRVRIDSPLEAIAHGIAYVPADRQTEGLFETMSVRDNSGLLILENLVNRLGLISMRALARRIQKIVEAFNIKAASINAAITSLSGGNQQKVVIGRSLSTEPAIVLLDDPTRGVDVGAKAEVHQILNRLTGQGCGVMLVSSELPEVLAMSDRVLVMYRGQVRAVLDHDEAGHELVMGLATGADTVAAVVEQDDLPVPA